MSEQAHVYRGSVWEWQGFHRIIMPPETRDDGARATVPTKPPAVAGVVQAVQASDGEPDSIRTSG